MDFKGSRVIVVGLGASGMSAARHLLKLGAEVVVTDTRDELALDDAASEMAAAGAKLRLGTHDAAVFRKADVVVVSPGVPDSDALRQTEARGVPILSEVELAARFLSGTLLAVTGTNGKSTVTTLLGEMCQSTGTPTFVGGNLGVPLCDAIESSANLPGGYIVAEVSSFQLERVDTFKPTVAVLLNLTEDHLDRHGSFAQYAAAKARIFRQQRSSDFSVIPTEDGLCFAMALAGAAQPMRFGGKQGAVRVHDGVIMDAESGLRVPVSEMKISGRHNLDNACASALAARLCGVPTERIEATLRSFSGLPHRMQLVKEASGVRYYDDSKATNVGATDAALRSFEGSFGKVVLIAGGRHKGAGYDPIVKTMASVGRAVVVIGEAAFLIEKAFASSGLEVVHAGSMQDAVVTANRLAREGDAVLLAPACSSYDMFGSYAERGRAFQTAVLSLVGAMEEGL